MQNRLLPRVTPQISVRWYSFIHLGWERCLAQEQNTMSTVNTRTQTARSEGHSEKPVTVDGVAFSFGNWSSWSMINLIMLYERNRYIYYGQWLVGSLGAPSSEWSENITPYPNLPKGAHPKFYFQTRFGILWEQESSVCLGFNLARIESSAFSSRWIA